MQSTKVWIGIDNGVTGTIGIIRNTDEGVSYEFLKTPVKSFRDYTKKVKQITRVDVEALRRKIHHAIKGLSSQEYECLLERPMINPERFQASISAARSFEATLIALEMAGVPNEKIEMIDSKTWFGALRMKGSDLCKIFIGLTEEDNDGLAIALYAYRRATARRALDTHTGISRYM